MSHFSNYIKISLCLLAVILLFSCKKEREKVYDVPVEIESYVRAFEADGQAEGMDLVVDDIRVGFGTNLELDGVEAAGICNFETSDSEPIITLDTTSENWQAHIHSRENLVYHELGHCILNRSHDNDRLPSNNYKSMMKASGEPIYADFSLFKRDYYIEELFDAAAPAPNWSSFSYGSINASEKTPIRIEDFDNNSNAWNLGSNEEVNTSLVNGVYRIENLIQNPRYVFQKWIIDDSKDFEIEMSMKIVSGGDFASGILWNSREEVLDFPARLQYFVIDRNRLTWLIDNYIDQYTSISAPDWIANEFNKITIRRSGDFVQFFINENPHDIMSFQEYGDMQGILVAGNTTIEVDYLNIYEINP